MVMAAMITGIEGNDDEGESVWPHGRAPDTYFKFYS